MNAKTKKPVQGAQNQHYVPKFVRRNFLSNQEKEQVSVFTKSTGNGFDTSIKNIMAERRFHDFNIDDDFIASFEESICRIEDQVLPTYQKIVENRQLDFTEDERANLALLISFQFLRTRAHRDMISRMESELVEHVENMGGKAEKIEGYEPLTDDRLKAQLIALLRKSILEYTKIIAGKDFLLMSAAKGRSFYLADNPVCLHNYASWSGTIYRFSLRELSKTSSGLYLPDSRFCQSAYLVRSSMARKLQLPCHKLH